jgi:hypothetical protein
MANLAQNHMFAIAEIAAKYANYSCGFCGICSFWELPNNSILLLAYG